MVHGFSRILFGVCVLALAGCAQIQVPRGPILLDASDMTVAMSFSRAAVNEDLRTLDETVRATVPDGASLPSAATIEAFLAERLAMLPEGASRRHVAALATELAGVYRSSHIYVLFPFENWNLDAGRGARTFDLQLSLAADGALRVDGKAVDSINGRAARDFVAWATNSYGQANRLSLPQRVRERGADMLWLWGLDAPFSVKFVDGSQETVAGALMTRRDHPLAGRSSGSGSEAASNAPFSLAIEGGVARLTVVRLDQRFESQWDALISRLRAGISAGEVNALVVDLRGNRGGAGRLSVRLLEVLAGAKVPTSGGKRWKRSQAYEAGLAEFVPPLLRLGPWRSAILGVDGVAALDSIPMNETRLFGGVAQPTLVPTLPADRVQVLIDQGTASSATQLARAVQYFGLGRLVGAPTANPTTELGEIAFFRLPNSQLVFASPSAEFLDVSGVRTEGPVMPDVLLCGANGEFAAHRAVDIALGVAAPDVRQIMGPVYQAAASEAQYCRQ